MPTKNILFFKSNKCLVSHRFDQYSKNVKKEIPLKKKKILTFLCNLKKGLLPCPSVISLRTYQGPLHT